MKHAMEELASMCKDQEVGQTLGFPVVEFRLYKARTILLHLISNGVSCKADREGRAGTTMPKTARQNESAPARKRRLEATTISSNVRVGLYGAEVNTLIPDISLRAKDLTKDRSSGNVNELYPDKTKMSTRQWKRESYVAIQK